MLPRCVTHPVITGSRPRTHDSPTPQVLTRLRGVALATLLVLPAAGATQLADANGNRHRNRHRHQRTITRTISSNGQIDIPTEGAATPYPATLNVNAFRRYRRVKIKDVNLTLHGLSHTYPEDIDVMLVHGGRQAIVMGDAGDNTDAVNVDITLDDEASANLPDGAPLVAGTFQPGNLTGDDDFLAPAPSPGANDTLNVFNRDNPSGTWQLYVVDSYGSEDGSIEGGWELEITAKVKKERRNRRH